MFDDQLLQEEGHMPEPAPGRKVRSFVLPVDDRPLPEKKTRRKKMEEEQEAPGLSEAELAAMNAEDYSGLSSSPRRRSREVALLLLFAAAGGSDWQFAANILSDTGISGENAEFALDLAKNAFSTMNECDILLAAYARDWNLDRFSAVDRNILRLAVSELKRTNAADHNIVINEAVELGKKFGSEESGSFINAILDNIYKTEMKKKQEQV